ncbi:rhomboid family intramembrane serine protease [bacterium]|nr:rhomboid family intramembrane serine protease [bacterium]
MDFQVAYWLYLLIFFSGLGIVLRLSVPIAYSWAPILQSLSILIIALVGLKIGPSWLFALVGYSLIVLIYLNSRSFYVGLQGSINALNAEKLHRLSKRARDIYWGKGGEFWHDMAEALALFIELKEDDANKLIEKWQMQVDSMPKEIRHLPGNYQLIGNALMRKWEKIVQIYEENTTRGIKTENPTILLPTARAYAELGEFEKSYQCIVKAKLEESQFPLAYVGQSILPFFALAGARKETEKLLEVLDKDKNTFPQSLANYWRGQSLLTAGDTATAIKFFEDAKADNPSKEFCQRVDRQIEKAKNRESELQSFHPDKLKHVNEVWNIFVKTDFVLAVVNPNRKSVAVLVLFILNTLVFLVSDAYEFPGLRQFSYTSVETLAGFTTYLIESFGLIPKLALAGQYYRFFTYSFLHANLTHYFLNMLMLYWFGRLAVNIFGTPRFLAIYIFGGFLGGIAQALIKPDELAIGASGCLMAAFGAVLAGIFRLKDRLPRSIWNAQMTLLISLAASQLLLDKIIPVVAQHMAPKILPSIADLAHLGGFLAGLCFGLLVSPVPSKITDKFIDEEAVSMSDPVLFSLSGCEEKDESAKD